MTKESRKLTYPFQPPKGLLEEPIDISENGLSILEKRYLLRDDSLKTIETVPQMYWRVASFVASHAADGDDAAIMDKAVNYYRMISSLRFSPNSPTFTGAGTPLGQLAACFVLAIDDDMGKDSEQGIFSTLRSAAFIQQTGGGVGFSFSRLRPRGSPVFSSKGTASGPVSFLQVYDAAFGAIAQGGTRRGANMAVLRVDHPDIEEFVDCKTVEGKLTNFNISVGITEAFMKAVVEKKPFDLIDPHSGKVARTVDAVELFNHISHNAHRNGEPGMLFLDTANASNPVPHLYTLESTNPCGEQYLGPYENCCLGSINLSRFFNADGKFDWALLEHDVCLATEFLDDVIDANKYVPAVPQLRESAQRVRRIGLGFMGLADVGYRMGAGYGSKRSLDLSSQIVEFIRYHAMLTSINLARRRGAFPAIKGSIYDVDNLRWTPPTPLQPYDADSESAFGRPKIDWNNVLEGIKKYGIRNGAQTTVAPTGTIGTVAGCEGYGCEPVFALAYTRRVHEATGDRFLNYVSPLFLAALDKANITGDRREKILESVLLTGSCSSVSDDLLPASIKKVFTVSSDVTATEHIYMQASLQRFVDNSISKTINFPSNASEDDVREAYMLAWKLGCKGLTIYVSGSRHEAVLETKATKQKQEEEKKAETSAPERTETPPTDYESDSGEDNAVSPAAAAPAPAAPAAAAAAAPVSTEGSSHAAEPGSLERPTISSIPYLKKRERPTFLQGVTYRSLTPLGDAYITINADEDGEPFEVFLNVGKGGSDVSAVSEALGRLMSIILRMPSMHSASTRLDWIVEQLYGIGGRSARRVGRERVMSLPDAIAKSLKQYKKNQAAAKDGMRVRFSRVDTTDSLSSRSASQQQQQTTGLAVGDLCPECGNSTLMFTEGCRKCYQCGHSEC